MLKDEPYFYLEKDGVRVEELSEDYTDQAKPIDLLHSDNYTTKTIRDERFEVCKGCERLWSSVKICKECGCFMAMKTWLKDASCPLGKW